MTPTDDAAARTRRIFWALGLVLLLGGWLSVLHVYRWHFTAPVFFLWAGWASLLACARFLYRAAIAAAEDSGDVIDDFWKPVGRHEELLLEKRSLLKAIKEIEFDREMGKMSEADAADLTRFYRQRAIEIIKALESESEAGEALSVQDQIEREIKARLVVAGASAKGKARAVRTVAAQTAQTTQTTATTETSATATAEAAQGAEAAVEKAAEAAVEPATEKAATSVAEKAAPGTSQKAKQKASQKAKQKAGQKKAGQKKAAAGEQPGTDRAAGTSAAGEQAEPETRPAAEDPS